MWEFLASHPWWGLIYLVIICATSLLCSIAWATRPSRRESQRGVHPTDLN
jgi:hypothetical protein